MNRTAQLLISAVFCAGSFAQSIPPAIDRLALETAVPFSQIGVTGNLSIPANIISSVTGGALEIRQSVELLGSNRLRVRHLLVPPAAPNPTPAGTQTAVIEDYIVRVENTVRTTDPGTLTFIGTVDQLNAPSPIIGRTGAPVIFSIGYDNSTPRKFGNIALLLPGRGSTWAQSSTGTLTFAGETTGGGTTPPTGNRPPVASAGTAARIATSQSEISLDAGASTDPDNDTLTYAWRVVTGAATILNPNMAQVRVQMAGNAGEYVFEVTVTDSRGASSKATITVFYTGRS
jgi:hypothetical protein